MRLSWASWATPLIALLAYLAFWPVGISPVAWQPPTDAGHSGPHAVNTRLTGLQHMPLAGAQAGPEFIVAHGGALYTGLGNGDIVRFSPDGTQRAVVVNTGGRPLGLAFDAQDRLLVADAVKGLLRVSGQGPQAQVEALLQSVPHPVPNDRLRYADAVAVAPDGVIWLSDASRRFGPVETGSTFEAGVLDTLEHSCTGRLVAQDPHTRVARVALTGLCFPNGLALLGDGKALLVAEMGTYRILKLDLAQLSRVRSPLGATAVPTLDHALQQGAATVWADNLPGFPDNLTPSPSGRIWVGLTKPRSPVIDGVAAWPFLRTLTMRLPRALWPVPQAYGHVIAFDASGKVLDDLQDPTGAYPETTSATELDGKLFIQSLNARSIAWMPYAGPGQR